MAASSGSPRARAPRLCLTPGATFPCRHVRVSDADTLVVDADVSSEFHSRTAEWREVRVRLAGVDAPESKRHRVRRGDRRLRDLHVQVHDAISLPITRAFAAQQPADAFQLEVCGTDSFGRVLGHLRHGDEPTTLSDRLLQGFGAKPYSRAKFTAAELHTLLKHGRRQQTEQELVQDDDVADDDHADHGDVEDRADS